MKRHDIEEKFFGFSSSLRAKIEQTPLPAVLAAFGVGLIFANFWHSLLLLLLILVAVAFAVWFLADEGNSEDLMAPRSGGEGKKGHTNGSGRHDDSGEGV